MKTLFTENNFDYWLRHHLKKGGNMCRLPCCNQPMTKAITCSKSNVSINATYNHCLPFWGGVTEQCFYQGNIQSLPPLLGWCHRFHQFKTREYCNMIGIDNTVEISALFANSKHYMISMCHQVPLISFENSQFTTKSPGTIFFSISCILACTFFFIDNFLVSSSYHLTLVTFLVWFLKIYFKNLKSQEQYVMGTKKGQLGFCEVWDDIQPCDYNYPASFSHLVAHGAHWLFNRNSPIIFSVICLITSIGDYHYPSSFSLLIPSYSFLLFPPFTIIVLIAHSIHWLFNKKYFMKIQNSSVYSQIFFLIKNSSFFKDSWNFSLTPCQIPFQNILDFIKNIIPLPPFSRGFLKMAGTEHQISSCEIQPCSSTTKIFSVAVDQCLACLIHDRLVHHLPREEVAHFNQVSGLGRLYGNALSALTFFFRSPSSCTRLFQLTQLMHKIKSAHTPLRAGRAHWELAPPFLAQALDFHKSLYHVLFHFDTFNNSAFQFGGSMPCPFFLLIFKKRKKTGDNNQSHFSESIKFIHVPAENKKSYPIQFQRKWKNINGAKDE
ncbi:hypothetical protein VP01_744g2 [Puccinia sorghi]|uniref:Uncharacterized protein n=1 Tax=Puccinia sorghi TaxID=27349 RepID=A0A0L6UDB6_9BASI|nr:hypothetical protein VP01_744g2 [Puccinia sorghi]